MPGRYTRFLSDGLPLFGEVGGLGLLQIPPMDLGQVEVIKGVASSMYWFVPIERLTAAGRLMHGLRLKAAT